MQDQATIRFSVPFHTGPEQTYLSEVIDSGHWHGDGPWTAKANAWLERAIGCTRALLTTSCTHALELAGMLLNLAPGDEVIVPSFTFSSTAAAVAVRGATPVFVDCTPDTLNIDPARVEEAITERTKAVYAVHYAGVGCDMTALQQIADDHDLRIVEDNAHGLGGSWQGQPLGSFGSLATQSFHDTKNVTCGEGGALLVNDGSLAERAEIIREKGTNRSRFLRGQIDKYTWVDQGSSFLPSELLAAILVAQLEAFDTIQQRRLAVWNRYSAELTDWAARYGVVPMVVPPEAEHPAHMFYLMMPSHEDQSGLLDHLRAHGIVGTFHYLPLDASPAGREYGRTPRPCTVTHDRSARLVRLPLFAGLTTEQVSRVIQTVADYRPCAWSARPGGQ